MAKKAIIIMLVALAFVVITACDSATNNSYSNNVSTDTPASNNAANDRTAADDSISYGGVNAYTFALIRNGMSMDEVRDIIGVDPTSETTSELFGITTTLSMWLENPLSLSSISIMLIDGYVTSTTQMELPANSLTSASAGGVNMDTFVSIQTGMSIEQVNNLVGTEPDSETTSEVFGITTTMATWMNSTFDTMTITFKDGYVSSTSQIGL